MASDEMASGEDFIPGWLGSTCRLGFLGSRSVARAGAVMTQDLRDGVGGSVDDHEGMWDAQWDALSRLEPLGKQKQYAWLK